VVSHDEDDAIFNSPPDFIPDLLSIQRDVDKGSCRLSSNLNAYVIEEEQSHELLESSEEKQHHQQASSYNNDFDVPGSKSDYDLL